MGEITISKRARRGVVFCDNEKSCCRTVVLAIMHANHGK